jgi:hypothetical protein
MAGPDLAMTSQAQTKADLGRLQASCAELGAQCDLHAQQVGLAATRRDVTQRLEATQAQYDAADAARDFLSIASLGKTLEALKAQSSRLALTQKDYLTLADRHAALVQRVVDTCRELAKAGKVAEVTVLAGKMETLQALDLSALPLLTARKLASCFLT